MLMPAPLLHLKPSLWLTVFLFLVVSSPPAPLTLSCVTEFGLCCPLSLIGHDSLEAVFSPWTLAGEKKNFFLEALFLN